jgi:uncharacterized protein
MVKKESPPQEIPKETKFKTGLQEITLAWGKLLFYISSDGMEVSLNGLTPGDQNKKINCNTIIKALSTLGVVNGIDNEKILSIIPGISNPDGWQGNELIAKGDKPQPYPNIGWSIFRDMPLPVDFQRDYWKIDKTTISFKELKLLYTAESLKTFLKRYHITVEAVGADDIIAELQAPKEHAIKDAYGRPQAADSHGDLEAGMNVVLVDEKKFKALVYGYLVVMNDEISLLPPIWISPDRNEARLLNLPQFFPIKFPSEDDVLGHLKSMDISHGIEKELISRVCQEMKEKKYRKWTALVAKSEPPRPGVDAKLDFSFEFKSKPGEIRPDGSIDLRELNLINSIRNTDLVARKRNCSEGIPGKTIYGEPIETTDGEDLKIKAGKGILVKEKEEETLFFADVSGVVSYRDDTISVSELMEIFSDIDYSTGNIDVQKDLNISGSVHSGFKVKSGGNLNISGMLESGSWVESGGNLTISNGILGETTKIICHGNMKTRFIQDARVYVKGDLEIGSYVYNATVHASGSIKIFDQGGSRAGSTIGGSLSSAKQISLSTSGSPSNLKTVLKIEPPPALQVRLKRINKVMEDTDKSIIKMTRTLELSQITPRAIKHLLARVTSDKRELFLKILTKLNNLIKYRQKFNQKKKKTENKIRKLLSKSTINISKNLYCGTVIIMGETSKRIDQDSGSGIHKLMANRIVKS